MKQKKLLFFLVLIFTLFFSNTIFGVVWGDIGEYPLSVDIDGNGGRPMFFEGPNGELYYIIQGVYDDTQNVYRSLDKMVSWQIFAKPVGPGEDTRHLTGSILPNGNIHLIFATDEPADNNDFYITSCTINAADGTWSNRTMLSNRSIDKYIQGYNGANYSLAIEEETNYPHVILNKNGDSILIDTAFNAQANGTKWLSIGGNAANNGFTVVGESQYMRLQFLNVLNTGSVSKYNTLLLPSGTIRDIFIEEDGTTHLLSSVDIGGGLYQTYYYRYLNGAIIIDGQATPNIYAYSSSFNYYQKLIVDGAGDVMILPVNNEQIKPASYFREYEGSDKQQISWYERDDITGVWSSKTVTSPLSASNVVNGYADFVAFESTYSDMLSPVLIGNWAASGDVTNINLYQAGRFQPVVKLFNPTYVSKTQSTTSLGVNISSSVDNVGDTPYYKYKLYNSAGSTLLQQTSNIAATSQTFSGLSANQKYDIVVEVYDSTGKLHTSSTILNDGCTLANAPTSTTITSPSETSTNMTITLNEGSNALETYYAIQVYDGGTIRYNSGYTSATVVTATGLAWNNSYYVKVITYNNQGTSSSTTTHSTFQTRAANPTSIALTGRETTSLSMTVTDSTSNYDTVYHYYRAYHAGTTTAAYNSGWTTSKTWTMSGLNPNKAYDIRVYTGNNGYSYTQSTIQYNHQTKALKPNSISVSSLTNSSFRMVLNENASNVDETNYRVYVYNSARTAVIRDFGYSNVTDMTVTGLAANTSYDVLVRTYTSGGVESSVDWMLDNTTTLASKPTSASVSGVSSTGLTVSLAESAANGNETYYRVYLYNDARTLLISDSGYSNTTSRTFTGLSPNTRYDVLVRTYNSSGVESSADWMVDATTTLAAKPNSVSISSVTNSSFGITINENSGNTNETYYRVYVYNDARTTIIKDFGYLSSTSLSATGLVSNKKHDILVRTYNINGVESSVDWFTDGQITLAKKPSSVSISDYTSSGFRVNITGDITNELAENYIVKVYDSSGVSVVYTSTISSSTAVTVAGLTANQDYDVQILTYSNNSLLSSTDWYTDNTRTLAVAPSSTSITNKTTTSMRLNITTNSANADTTYYVIKVYDETRTRLIQTTALTSSTVITYSGLGTNEKHDFLIETYNTNSVLSASGWYQAGTSTLALQPSAANLSSYTTTGFIVNLTENATNIEETSYQIEVFKEDTTTPIVVTSALGTSISRTITGLQSNQGYDVYVKTYANDGTLSATTKMVDSAITLAAEPTSGTVTARTRDSLTTTLVESASNVKETYYIYKVYDGAVLINTSPLTASNPYTSTGLSYSRDYLVMVETYNAANALTGVKTVVASALTDAGLPTYTTAIEYTTASITLTDNITKEFATNYKIELIDTTLAVIDSFASTTAGTRQFTGLSPATTYAMRVSYKTSGLSSFQYSFTTESFTTKSAYPPTAVNYTSTDNSITYTLTLDPRNDPATVYRINGSSTLTKTGLSPGNSYPTTVTVHQPDGTMLGGSYSFATAYTLSKPPTISAVGSGTTTIVVSGTKNPLNTLATQYSVYSASPSSTKTFTADFSTLYTGLQPATKYDFQVSYRTAGLSAYQTDLINISGLTEANPPTLNITADGVELRVDVYNNVYNNLGIECQFQILNMLGTVIETADAGTSYTFKDLEILTQYEIRVRYKTMGATNYQSSYVSSYGFTEGPETPEINLSNLGAETAFTPVIFVIDSEMTTMVDKNSTLTEWQHVESMISEIRYYIGPQLTPLTDLKNNYTPTIVTGSADYVNNLINVSGAYSVYIEVDTITGETLTDYEPIIRLILIADQDTIGMDGTSMYQFNYTVLRRMSDNLVVPHNITNLKSAEYVDGLIYVYGDTTGIFDNDLNLVATLGAGVNDVCSYNSDTYIAMNSGLYTYYEGSTTQVTSKSTSALEDGFGVLYVGEGTKLVGYTNNFTTPEFELETGKTIVAIKLIGDDIYLFSNDGYVGIAN